MNALGLAFTIVMGMLMLGLPRRWAVIPLVLATIYMTRGQELNIGGANFTVLRILVPIGFLRVLLRGERLANGMRSLDWLMMAWGILLLLTSAFHEPGAFMFRAGIVWGELGCYFLLRLFITDTADVERLFKLIAMGLLPVGILMLHEKMSGYNYYAIFGGVIEYALVRDGHARATGPFAHPILAGTVGAASLAMAIYLWSRHWKTALTGTVAASAIILASTSSGPILMSLAIGFAMLLWPLRRILGLIRILAVLAILALAAVMNDPVYFLMARVDLTGGSQGYFRAQLIRSAVEHLPEWWLYGTDYTRHWMASGIYANTVHTDIVNHFLAMGVMGGLPLMFTFIALIVSAFRAVGRAMKDSPKCKAKKDVLAWALGAALFGYVVNFFSISIYDQSVVFFYLLLAAIAALEPQRLPARSEVASDPRPALNDCRTAVRI